MCWVICLCWYKNHIARNHPIFVRESFDFNVRLEFSEHVDRDKHSDGIFRRTLKMGENLTKNHEKQPKNWEKNFENLEIGKKIFGRHPEDIKWMK